MSTLAYWSFLYIFVYVFIWMRRESIIRYGCHYPMNLNSLGHCMWLFAPRKDIGYSGTRTRPSLALSQPRFQ